ncbi:hypothetical protein L0938_17000 [Paracidovorax citrulli]
MRRFLLAFTLMFMVFGAAAAKLDVSELKKRTSLVTTGGDQDKFKRLATTKFGLEERIVYITGITWEPIDAGAGRHKIRWRWYSGDTAISELKQTVNFTSTPFETIGTIPASVLGEGDHRVELYIDDALFDTTRFSVVPTPTPTPTPKTE